MSPLTFQPLRRSFFSLSGGGSEQEEGRTKETRTERRNTKNDKAKNFTTTTDNNTTIDLNVNREWEDNYRRPITRELWDEFKNEGKRTRNYLSSQSLLQPPQSPMYSRMFSPNGYEEILTELHATIHETWNGPNALEPPPEYGPTGKWTYKFEVSADDNRRIYQRCLSFGNAIPETVLELPPTAEALAMSLTPDEALIACLMQPDDNSSSPRVTLRSVESKIELNLDGTDWIGDIAKMPSEIFGLEWGPIVTQEKMAGSIAQNNGTTDFVYSLYLLLADHQGRPNRVALCYIDPLTLELTIPPTLIYSSDDPAVMVDVQRTKGCSFVCIRALSKTSSEVFLSQGDRRTILVRSRQESVLYHVDVGKEGDVVILTSNEWHPNGGDYFLEETTVDALPLPSETSLPLQFDEQDYFLEDMDLFRSQIVLYERSRKNGNQRVKLRQRGLGSESSRSRDTILDLSSVSSESTKNSALGEPILPLFWSKLSPVGNMCFESNLFRFELESPLAPGQVYEYDFDTQQVTMVSTRIYGDDDATAKHQDDIPPDQAFRKETIMVESLDGTEVPLTLFCKTENDETKITNQQKTIVLVGYGAYGEPMDLGYNPGWKPLLDRGITIAFAHTRGGGDLGRAWYAKGRNENKQKGIEDYEACAFFLRERFNDGQKSISLVAKAFSAGGVLVGAAINRNPGLFDKVILTNAFVDVASTMDKPSLFLTEHEYDEFGNPKDNPITKERILSYCPLYNLQPQVQSKQTSTRFLLIGTLDDPNVPYWNASLYFRKLLGGFKSEGNSAKYINPTNDSEMGQELQENDRIFLELQTSGGHHFSGPNRIDVLALENAFILKEV